jgi:hypothetical protein
LIQYLYIQSHEPTAQDIGVLYTASFSDLILKGTKFYTLWSYSFDGIETDHIFLCTLNVEEAWILYNFGIPPYRDSDRIDMGYVGVLPWKMFREIDEYTLHLEEKTITNLHMHADIEVFTSIRKKMTDDYISQIPSISRTEYATKILKDET